MNSKARGSVLLLCLWGLGLLVLITITLATRVRLELKWAQKLMQKEQARALAWTGVQVAVHELVEDKDLSWDSPKELWGRQPARAISFRSGAFNYSVSDEQAKIALNISPLETITALPGFSPQSAAELLARRAAGEHVLHLAELKLLPGFRAQELPQLIPLISLRSAGGVNLNSASYEVMTRMGLSSSLAQRILEFRHGPDGVWTTADDGTFSSQEALLQELDERFGPLLGTDASRIGELLANTRLDVASSFFEIQGEGWAQEAQAYVKVKATVERGDGPKRIKIKDWYEA